MADEWQTQKFRQNVIAKINEYLQSTGQEQNKNASVMESHIFKKSRSKDEYLGLVAKLFMHFKDLAQRKPQQAPQMEMGQQNMMQDPLNALQNLASQGNRNPQMMPMAGGPGPSQMSGGPVPASNLLQTLNQQRPGQQQMQQMQGIRPQMAMGGPGGPGQQMVPQMGSMPGQMQQMSGPGGPGSAPGGAGMGPGGPPNQMQMNAAQMQQGGGVGPGQMNVGGMNAQQTMPPQMQQMQQNQMNMGMNHAQINQMMNARMNQQGPGGINVVGPNAGGQGMQGLPQNMPPNQGTAAGAGPMHSANVGPGVPQVQQVGGGPVMTGNAPQGNLNQMLNMPPNMQQKPNMPIAGQPGAQMFAVQRGVGVPVGGPQQQQQQQQQQQFLRHCSSPNTPATAAAQQQQLQQQQQQQQQQQLQQQQIQQQQQQQQQQPSGIPPQQTPPHIPAAQMIPSPALVPTSSPQMSNLMPTAPRNLRQSPSAPLNTPGYVGSNSPFNPQEEQLYREKYKQLTKYIEPLKRMVAKAGSDGTNAKMSKLLEILINPAQRVPLETLLKCEKALDKMELVSSYSGQQFGKSTNPLLEVINTTLQSPIANHTLNRTFRPSLDLLFGTDISAPTPSKIQRVSEPSKMTSAPFELEIPHVLQGELARLDQKFKVTLDTTTQNNTKVIKLICCLDDKKLPTVPPVSITIPEDYPWTSPECYLAEAEYTSTPFLNAVQNALKARVAKLPKLHSLSHLLDTWEMSVRQACSPSLKATAICDFTTVFSI